MTTAASARAAAWRRRSRSPSSPRTPRACSAPGDRLRARPRHLDGRHGRPGARPRPSRAVRTLTLGCTYCGGEGSALASPDVAQRLVEAMTLRRPRAHDPRRLGDHVSPAFADDADAYAAFRELCLRAPRSRGAGDHGSDAGDRAHDTPPACPSCALPTLIVHGTADQMLPVAERRHDRRATSRSAPGDPRRRRPPVLLGAPAALGRAGARARAVHAYVRGWPRAS